MEVTVTAVLCGGTVVSSLTYSFQITRGRPQLLVVCPQQFSIRMSYSLMWSADILTIHQAIILFLVSIFTQQCKKYVLTGNWLPFVGLNISDFVLSFEVHVQM